MKVNQKALLQPDIGRTKQIITSKKSSFDKSIDNVREWYRY